MHDLLQMVKAYLDEPETDYAIMIEGAWGSGKTFFWKNRIAPEIARRVSTKNRITGHASIKPIYVSLYGITRPEDIDREVFFSLYPLLGSKGAKRFMSLAKPLGKVIPWFDLDKITEFDPRDWTNLVDVVLCFDDLERCSIKVGDVLGRINRYVEHEGTKTVILCNPSAIRPAELAEYNRIKEKVVGRSIQFRPDQDGVFEALVKSYSSDKLFCDFLQAQRMSILALFQKSESENVRLLRHALSHIHVAFKAIANQAPYANAARQAMVRMILPLTLEYESASADKQQVEAIATYSTAFDIAWVLTDRCAMKFNL